MRVGLYFGSFNPPHVGHTIIAEYMLHYTQCDEIWLVISPQNPHKDQNELLGEDHRASLVKRALGGHDRIKTCTFEFDLPRPSYTVDTMNAMEEKHPDIAFSIIMGSDNIKGIRSWKAYEELLARFPIYVHPRPGYQVSSDELKDLPGEIYLTEAPQMDLSSTRIRDHIGRGIPCSFMVRSAVWREILRKGHYLADGESSVPSEDT